MIETLKINNVDENSINKIYFLLIENLSLLSLCLNNSYLECGELINVYRVFAPMLGILDARFDEACVIDEISLSKSYEDIVKHYNQEKEKTDIIKNYRKQVVNDYKAIVKNMDIDTIQKVIDDGMPLHKNFQVLARDMQVNHYSENLQGEFMKSYLTGYIEAFKFPLKTIMEMYTQLIADFNKKIEKNIYKVKKK